MFYLSVSNNKRINWIDIAKGIGIILVVFSHTSSLEINKLVFSFHMPLFFILAGLVFSSKSDFKSFCVKKIKTLYIPFLVFLTADYIIFAIRNLLSGTQIMLKDFAFFYLIQLSGANLSSDSYLYNGPIWFLCALFFSELVFYWIAKINQKVIVAIIGIICALVSRFLTKNIPFAISYIFPIVAFMTFGYTLKEKLIAFTPQKKRVKYILCLFIIVAFTLLYLLSSKNDFVVMRALNYGNIGLFYLNALLGSFVIIIISVVLGKNRFLEFWGQNSVIVLCFHLLFCNVLLPNISEFIFNGNKSIISSPITEIIIVILSFVLLYPVVLFCNRYLYFIFGRKRKTEK